MTRRLLIQMTIPVKYLTVKEASIILGLSTRRIRKKITQNKRKCFPGAIKPSHEWRIPENEVLSEKSHINSENETKEPVE